MEKTNQLKHRIRQKIKQRLIKQNQTQRLRKSRLIQKRLFKLAEFARAKCVMFYIAKQEEVETKEMIAAAQKIGKKIVVPAISAAEDKIMASEVKDLNKELSKGPHGVKQPKKLCLRRVAPETIDLVLVPGLAFDCQGRRLGRGRGYYDRFLAGLPAQIPRIGLAFNFQVLDEVPASAHDICVGRVISA